MTDPQSEITALRAIVAELEEAKKRTITHYVNLLSSTCTQTPACARDLSLEAFIAAGGGACSVCLTRRVAELESELAETLEDAVRQGAHRQGDGTYHSNGISTWRDMMERLAELGRFEITWVACGKIVSGRFLPRKESNGATQ